MSGTDQITQTPQPSGSSWTLKKIDVTITLGAGSFGTTGGNKVKLSGLRVMANVLKTGYPGQDKATVRVYGLPPSVMNEVSTLGIPLTMVRPMNQMLIEAGDDESAMSIVYNGYLQQAYQDFEEIPETSLVMVGWGAAAEAIQTFEPTSFAGSADVASIMSSIASRAGWKFENSGVQVRVSNQYLRGNATEQYQELARAANIEAYLDTGTAPKTLAIWPKYKTRGGLIPLINLNSGLVGYPKFQSNGMWFRCLFNPSIRLGGQIKMDSIVGGGVSTVTPAQVAAAKANNQYLPPWAQTAGGPNGLWYVIAPFSYDLAAQLPGGPWFCNVHCARLNVTAAQ